MFFKRNANQKRRTKDPGADVPPRIARLIRESWWLLVVAAFLYLALILATYTKADAGWSYSGNGAPIANRGGVVGAWLSDLLLYLFGFSAWWWVVGGVVLVVLGYRRVVSPEHRSDHPLALGGLGFALVLLSSASLESIRLWRLPAALPLAPGGALGDMIGHALSRGSDSTARRCCCSTLFAVGTSLLFTGVSWLKVMEHIGTGRRERDRERAQAARSRAGSAHRCRARGRTRIDVSSILREDTALREPILIDARRS